MGDNAVMSSPIETARRVRDRSVDAVLSDMALPLEFPLNVQGVPAKLLTKEEIEITELDPVLLVKKMSSKALLCETVIKAFLRRAALAQVTTNCVTELLPSHAISRARYLDSLDAPIGPLHGLPISIKENFGFDGGYNTNSLVAFGDRLQIPACSLNGILEKQCGGIIFARTTQPQSVMHLETSSNLYGRTLNPWNTSLTSGGSSGGEGALVGFRGSPLGIGGDIGGSIRNPAANNGVYGFKPSPYRIGNTGGMGAVVGQEGIIVCMGPLAPTLSGIELFMKAYLETWPWVAENYLLPLPWRDIQLPSKLKIGVMWSDGVVKPHPPVLRALSLVVDALKSSTGFQVVDWEAKDHDECWNLTTALYYEDGGRRIKQIIESGREESLPLTEWILNQPNVRYRTVEEVWDLKAKRNAYRSSYNKHWLDTGASDGHPVDAILCPVGPGCAPPHEKAKYWSYTSQWNLLEYPAISFPVTRVDQDLDRADECYSPANFQDEYNHHLYEGSEQYRDAPVSLQLVTRRYEDEKCLAVLRRIEAALGR